MPGRRRGARSGRGWDAAPARPRAAPGEARTSSGPAPEETYAGPEQPLWHPDEGDYRPGPPRPRQVREPKAREPEPRDPRELAREICLRQLAVRPRTRQELATALRRRGIADEVAAEILDRYDEVGLIDDAAFARAWVSSRHHGRGLARRALANELRQRGVAGEVAVEALDEVDEETEAATARALVDRKLRTTRGAAPDVLLRRLVGTLARRGYPPGLALRVVKEALAAASDEQTAGYAEFIDPDAESGMIGETDGPIR